MTNQTMAILLATAFTAGCVTIHDMRERAKAMTPPLVLIAMSLGLFVAGIAMARKPGAIDRETAVRVTKSADWSGPTVLTD